MQAVLLCKTDTCSPPCGRLRPETPRTPRRSTWLVLLSRQLGTFARKLASLKQYGLVRLALQAVPSHFSDSRSTAARLLETCSSGFIKSLACLLTMEYISINHCINRGRIISAPTRLHYLSVAVFLRANFVRHYGVSLEMDCKIPLCQVDKLVFPHKSYYVKGGFSHLIHMTAAHLW